MLSSSKMGLLTAALSAASLSDLPTTPQWVFRGYGKFACNGTSRAVKRYPQMVVSSPEEITEWNRKVNTRQVTRQNVHRLSKYL